MKKVFHYVERNKQFIQAKANIYIRRYLDANAQTQTMNVLRIHRVLLQQTGNLFNRGQNGIWECLDLNPEKALTIKLGYMLQMTAADNDTTKIFLISI
jgi:hypothetical protein